MKEVNHDHLLDGHLSELLVLKHHVNHQYYLGRLRFHKSSGTWIAEANLREATIRFGEFFERYSEAYTYLLSIR